MALAIYCYVATVCPCTLENIILYYIIAVVDLNKYITLCDDVDSSKTTISKTHGARRYIYMRLNNNNRVFGNVYFIFYETVYENSGGYTSRELVRVQHRIF